MAVCENVCENGKKGTGTVNETQTTIVRFLRVEGLTQDLGGEMVDLLTAGSVNGCVTTRWTVVAKGLGPLRGKVQPHSRCLGGKALTYKRTVYL